MEREQIIKQMQEWCDNMCENACLKGESLNGKIHTCEICFPNTVRNALALIKSQEQRIKEQCKTAKKLRKQLKKANRGVRIFANRTKQRTEENKRLRDELAERPPKLVITKLPKKEGKE